MRALLILALLAGPAGANADREPDDVVDETKLIGPFSSLGDYCKARLAKRDPGATCDAFEDDRDDPVMPVDRASGLRAVRVIVIEGTWHFVAHAPNGWYGRAFASDGPGDYTTVDKVALGDIVGDSEAELYFEHSHTHEPCGCGDPSFRSTYVSICRVQRGGLACTNELLAGERNYGVEIEEWSSSWKIERNGRVTPKITPVQGITRRQQRAMAAPFWLRFR